MRWAEGPVYFPEERYVLVSDIPNNRIMKYSEKDGSFTVFRSPSNYANGNTRDQQARLVTCEHSVTRRITRTEKDGKITILADRFEGKRLNAPNDIVVKSDESIWFTDPLFGILGDWEGNKEQPEQARTYFTLPLTASSPPRSRILSTPRSRILAGREEALRRRMEGHAQPQHLEL
jgi:gluconolactonase